jgi:hypothetical protein
VTVDRAEHGIAWTCPPPIEKARGAVGTSSLTRTTSLEAVPRHHVSASQKKSGGKIYIYKEKERKNIGGRAEGSQQQFQTRLVQQRDALTMYFHSVVVLHPAVSREDSHSHQTDT